MFLMLHVIINLLLNFFFLYDCISIYNYLKPYPSIWLVHQCVVMYLLVPSLVQFLFQVCIARHWFCSRIFCSSFQKWFVGQRSALIYSILPCCSHSTGQTHLLIHSFLWLISGNLFWRWKIFVFLAFYGLISVNLFQLWNIFVFLI